MLIKNPLNAIFKRAASGAAPRAIKAKLNDIRSIKDFGATGLAKDDGKGAHFARSSQQFLEHASNASLQTGDIALWVVGAFYFDSADDCGLMMKGAEWKLLRLSNTINFYVNGFSASVGTGAAATGQWHIIQAWHDPTANTLNIQLNADAPVSVAHSVGITTDSSAFWIGKGYDWLDGRADCCAIWKRLPSAGDRASYYNSGGCWRYEDLPAGLFTNLVSWWDLEGSDADGVWVDSHGANDLTTTSQPLGILGVTPAPSADDDTAIDAALSDAQGVDGGVLYFPDGRYRIGTNTTFPASVQLAFDHGARLIVPNGVTASFLGPVEGPDPAIIGLGSWTFAPPATFGDIVLPLDAAGDGIEDDTVILQSAIDSAISVNAGGHVYFPPGTYRVTDTLVVDSVNGLTFQGSGHATKFLWDGPGDRPLMKVVDARHCCFSNFHVHAGTDLLVGIQQLRSGASVSVVSTMNRYEGVTLTASGTSLTKGWQFGGTGAYDANNDFTTLIQCAVANAQHSAFAIEHSQSYGNLFLNCRFDGDGSNSQYGVYVSYGYFTWIDGDGYGNVGADFYISSAFHQPTLIKGGSYEGSKRFLETSTFAGCVSIEGCRIANNLPHADGDLIIHSGIGRLSIRDCSFNDGNPTPANMRIRWGMGAALGGGAASYVPGSSFAFVGNRIIAASGTPFTLFSDSVPTEFRDNMFKDPGGGDASAAPVPMPTFTDADTTPSVFGGELWTATNSGATTITTFDDGYPGKKVTVRFTNGNTTVAVSGNVKLAGGVDFVGTANDTLTLLHDGTNWLEVGRSIN